MRLLAWLGVMTVLLSIDAARAQVCDTVPRRGARCSLGGIEFVAIDGGEFEMGDGSPTADASERPAHPVVVDGFWMARTELTFGQWQAFLRDTGRPRGRSRATSDDHPVVGITWDDAMAYCAWFSRTHAVVMRLPSEAEWEYAARGGLEGRRFPNGDTISRREANYDGDGSVKVASYPPNGRGLHDMAGNVFEWVGDWYDKDYYRVSPRRNPRGPDTSSTTLQRRADRGGGWCMGIERVRVSARHAGPGSWDQGGTANCLGFRPVIESAGRRRHSGS
jgi:formylglycine-generating enzyme required for sulfatase activity